jgi:phage terminase large subunit-like protein
LLPKHTCVSQLSAARTRHGGVLVHACDRVLCHRSHPHDDELDPPRVDAQVDAFAAFILSALLRPRLTGDLLRRST